MVLELGEKEVQGHTGLVYLLLWMRWVWVREDLLETITRHNIAKEQNGGNPGCLPVGFYFGHLNMKRTIMYYDSHPINSLFCVRSQHVQCCIYTTCIIHIFRTEAMNAFISTLVTGFHLWKRLLGLRLPCRSRVSICSVASSPPSSASISSPPASTSASHSIPSPLLPLLIPFSPRFRFLFHSLPCFRFLFHSLPCFRFRFLFHSLPCFHFRFSFHSLSLSPCFRFRFL